MQIAIQSILVLFFVALPGVIFRRSYFISYFAKQFDSKSWSHSLFFSLIIGLGIHFLLIIVFYQNSLLPEFDDLSVLKNNEFFSYYFSYLKEIDGFVLVWYISLLFLSPVFLALSLYSFVRLFRLDLKFSVFRFSNHWHYYFRGEIRYHKDFSSLALDKNKKIILSIAEVLCKINNFENVIYRGVLTQYTICKNKGNLSHLYLTGSDTDSLSIERSFGNTNNFIGSCFIIPIENVININLKYVYQDSQNRKVRDKKIKRTFKLILFSLYFFNCFEFITITKYDLVSAIILKLIGHILIFSLVNALQSSMDKSLRGDSRVGFWFLTIIMLVVYILIIYGLNTI